MAQMRAFYPHHVTSTQEKRARRYRARYQFGGK